MMKGMDKLRYQRDFLNIRPIFTAGEQEYLTELSDRLPLSVLTDSVRNIEEIGIDFVYSSAKLEGNTYNQYDTQALLKLGQTAGGKLYSDAVMLINLRESYRHLLPGLDSPKPFDWLDFLKTTHSLISENLLEKGSGGVVRRDSVTISGTDYTPLSNPQSLDTELKWLLQEAPKIENPFDRAVYLHNNLAYLRYFKDCNKRTARNCMTLTYCQKLYDLVADALRFFSLRILPRQLSRLCRGCRSLLRNRRLRFIQEIFYFGIRKYRK